MYKEYERISNNSVNGEKIIEEVEQRLGLSPARLEELKQLALDNHVEIKNAPYLEGFWRKKGYFDRSNHSVKSMEFRWGSELQRNTKFVYFKVCFEDWQKKPGKLIEMEICPREEKLIKEQLGISDIPSEVEFWYGIFGELEDRLILRKKSPQI